ncbi:hypothetical protein IHE31_01605 (plasmid) [Mycetohabitans rhizoxinica]|uniref:hypothetical protein n=1 Tax=Mycetohabitans rhizoxinica TaxID=412963 RepID=UPI0030CF9079
MLMSRRPSRVPSQWTPGHPSQFRRHTTQVRLNGESLHCQCYPVDAGSIAGHVAIEGGDWVTHRKMRDHEEVARRAAAIIEATAFDVTENTL